MAGKVWLNERRLRESFLTHAAAERKEKIAKRFSLTSPMVQPYARMAKILTAALLPGLINKKGHPQIDKRFFCDFRLGVAVMLACGYPHSTETDLQELEEGAYRLACKRDWLQYVAKRGAKHAALREPVPQEEFRELIAKLSEEERYIAEAAASGEKQEHIAQAMGIEQSTVSKKFNAMLDRFTEMELERNKRECPLFYDQ